MEPIVLVGGIIVAAGCLWTIEDMLRDLGYSLNWRKRLQRYSDFSPLDMSSRTASRAGLS